MYRPSLSESAVQTQVPKADQAALNSDDLSELLSIVSSTSSGESSHEYAPAEVRSIEGSSRLFSAQNQIYLLPLDEVEFKRLDKQHSLLRVGMTGLFPARKVVNTILTRHKAPETAVLDIGCGAGQWALDLVAEFEQIRVVAIDQIPQMEGNLPSGIEFRRHDVNDGLAPFYDEFDVVHCRCVASGIESYRNLLQEAVKCLRPGGIAIFIEGDFDLFTPDQKTIQEPASDTNPNGSWLQRWMQAVRMAQVKRCGINDADDCPETLDKGLWQFDSYDPQSCGVGSIFTPTSPWPRGTMEEENIHFKVAGVLMRQNLKLFLEATEQMLIEDGISREETAQWKSKAREEMDSITFKTWFRWRIAWGCAPKLPEETEKTERRAIPSARPQMILGEANRAVRHALLSQVETFKHKQSHFYNRPQALSNLEKRKSIPFSTRGRF